MMFTKDTKVGDIVNFLEKVEDIPRLIASRFVQNTDVGWVIREVWKFGGNYQAITYHKFDNDNIDSDHVYIEDVDRIHKIPYKSEDIFRYYTKEVNPFIAKYLNKYWENHHQFTEEIYESFFRGEYGRPIDEPKIVLKNNSTISDIEMYCSYRIDDMIYHLTFYISSLEHLSCGACNYYFTDVTQEAA